MIIHMNNINIMIMTISSISHSIFIRIIIDSGPGFGSRIHVIINIILHVKSYIYYYS